VRPLILAVDTTRELGSLAVARGGGIVEEILLRAPDGFAHVIYEHLAGLLARHDLEADDIDCFAAASGPGSFTGVRVGLACIKGLAEVCGRPAVAVSNLQALAACGSAPLRAAVLDARRGQVYGAVYDSEGCVVAPETVADAAKWLDGLPQADLEFVTLDPDLVRGAFTGTRYDGASVTTAPQALAGAIARIACTRFLRGEAADPALLDANYVRRSDPELFWKE